MDLEIPVVFDGEQKWITGLSRSTTCDDVIYALLRHNQGPNDSIDVSEYRMYEEWKDFSRTLSGRTRIVKLWRLLGSKARSIRLVIRLAPSTDVFDTGSEMSYNTRNRRARRLSKTPTKQQLTKADVYQYYNRKERSKTYGENTANDATKTVENVYSYVSMVTKQQKELDELTFRNAAMDAHISNYEAIYQYPCDEVSPLPTSNGDASLFPSLKAKDIETYLKMIEGILGLHDHIEQTHSKACYLASVISEEQQVLAAKRLSKEISEDIERTRQRLWEELEQCQTLAKTQQNELQLLGNALQHSDMQLLERQQELNSLSEQLNESDLYHEDIQEETNQTYRDTYKPSEPSKISQNSVRTDHSIAHNTHLINTSQEKSKYAYVPNERTHSESLTCPNKYDIQNKTSVYDNRNNINYSQQETDCMQNDSYTKLDNDRSKGVRFNADVTKWMYDVLSEDESHLDGNSQSYTKENQYSQGGLSAMIQTQNTINSMTKSPPEQKRSCNVEFAYTGSGSFDPYIMPYNAHLQGLTYIGIDDSNSDTGLSSMNSEEEASTPLETLV